jgi:hypothetical protein
MAIGLPLSKFLMSISQFWMAVSWLAYANFPEKWSRLKTNFIFFLPFLGIYLLTCIGLLWSEDLAYGIHDVKVKLPMLVIPFMVVTMPGLSLNRFYLLLKLYLGALTVGVLVSLWFYFGFSAKPILDIREISRFVSHIRFSLMLCLGVFISLYFYWNEKGNRSFAYLLLALSFSAFLFILHSSTGLVMVLLLGIFSVFYMLSLKKHIKSTWSILTFVLLIILISIWDITSVWKTAFPPSVPISSQLIKNGRHLYFNDTTYKARENGNYVWINIEIVGLKSAWKQRTKERLDDSIGTNRVFVLVRYLSSLGLPKDSESVMQLTQAQIMEIQGGCTNYKFCNTFDPRYRMYQTLWEIEDYQHQGNADGHSVVMRWEFWKAGINILKKHWLFGVGTGDVANAFSQSYDEIKSELNPEYRLRAHNQYLTFTIALGMFGFVPILYFFFLWVKIRPKAQNRNYLAWVFLITSFLSMINEDTLETQAGVSFIAYFACLFLVLRITPQETVPIEEKAR